MTLKRQPVQRERIVRPARAYYNDDCTFCIKLRNERGPKPPHAASERCQSGGRDHCTCDVCF